MKKLLMPIAGLLCLATMFSCKKSTVETAPIDPTIINPITDFQVIKDNTDPFKFTFKNQSSKYKRIEWRFGDDSLSVNDSPTHIYLKTGKFSVDVRTYSETGTSSRKVFDLIISPDSVGKIILVPQSGNRIQFALSTKATFTSTTWSFSDTATNVFTSATPVKTFTVGTFNTATVTIKTPNGSVATLTPLSNITSVGLVQNITPLKTRYTVSAENTYNAAENSTMLMDGNLLTKLTMGSTVGRQFTFPYVVSVFFNTPQKVVMYAIGNGNDNAQRDAKAWTIQGSNDGVTWTVVDTRLMVKNFHDQMTDLLPPNSADALKFSQIFYFAVANPQAFTQYKWVITDCFDTGNPKVLCASEFRLFSPAQ